MKRPAYAGPPTFKSKTETIFGVHSIEESLLAGETIHKIITTRERARHPKIKELLARAQARRIGLTFEGDAWFSRRDAHHQHIAAIVDAFEYASWVDVQKLAQSAGEIMIVALDHVEDPQNVGALMRNAEGAGAAAVILPERRGARVTPTARRAAAGAASHLKVATVPNVVHALDALRAAGCWVTGLSSGPEAVPYSKADLTGKRVFVVGAEGGGLHRLVLQHCDDIVRIPLLGKVSSLNVASAAGIVLFEAVRQRQNASPRPRPNNAQSPAKP